MKKNLLIGCFVALLLAISGCGANSQPTTAPTLVAAATPAVAAHSPAASPPETLIPQPASPAQQLPVLYDDDGSPDGTTALFYLLSHPEVSVEAISISYGEAYPELYIQHIGRELETLGIKDIPLGAGQDAPLAGSNEFPEWMREGANEFWGLPIPNSQKTFPARDAAELMISILNQAAEPITLFVSGPCTNLAQALRLDPGIAEKIAEVYIMGGAVYVPGNIADLLPDSGNMMAEWNIYADPQAAAEVFSSGLELYLVPLDATNQVTVGKQDTEQWRSGGGAADFAADVYDMMLDGWGAQAVPVWDLMTAAIMVSPDLCGFQPLRLEVVTGEGSTSGQTVVVAGGEPNLHACLEPDIARIKQTLIDVFAGSR